MMIREARQDRSKARELKVRIPMEYLVKLHSLKVLTGKQVSETVREALDAYFSDAMMRRHGAPVHGGVALAPSMPEGLPPGADA